MVRIEEFNIRHGMKDEIVNIIIKFHSRNATEDEIQLLMQWIKENENNKRLFDEVSDIWLVTAKNSNKLDFDTVFALRKVKAKLKTRQITLNKNRFGGYSVFLKIAALFILAYGLGLATYTLVRKDNYKLNDETTKISAPIGSKSKITLPDGTQVWLNAGSTISYSGNFNKVNRDIELEGEAYFDVVKNKNLPFIVKTNDIRVKVLGTAFNIKAYPDEGSAETTLVRGSLIVENNSKNNKVQRTVLSPNQRATFIKSQGKVFLTETEKKSLREEKVEKVEGTILLSKKVDTEVFTAWKDNRLIIRNESFESLVLRLERWYGVQIQIKNDEIKNYHFNGTIENETIQDVLEIIKYTLPIKYSIQHNIIAIWNDKT
jgi:transmembrane sensor